MSTNTDTIDAIPGTVVDPASQPGRRTIRSRRQGQPRSRVAGLVATALLAGPGAVALGSFRASGREALPPHRDR